MRDPDRPLSPEALRIMQCAVVADLRSNANELAALVRETLRPLPVLPLDPAEREAALMILLLEAGDRSRRLLALVDVRS